MKIAKIALSICVVATSAACGDVSSGEAAGEALYSVPGRLSSGSFATPEGNYGSVLTWLSIGGGPFVECLEENAPQECRGVPDYDATLTVESARLVPAFPSRFTLEVIALPRAQDTLRYKDSVLAFGSVSLYDDRNENGMLDLIEDAGAEDADRMVAKSALAGPPSVIVFREGPLHPAWKVLRAFGCADPPPGFSMVVNPISLRCAVQPIAELRVSPITTEASQRDVCALEGLSAQPELVPRFEFALSPQAVVTCDPSGDALTYYIDRGNLCDAYFERRLELRGCASEPELGQEQAADCWDLTDSPPTWWPC